MKKTILLSALLISSFSCIKEKGQDCGTIMITADWGNLPKCNDMRFIFYPDNGERPINYTIKSGIYTFNLPQGKYKVLFFNNDTKNILFQNIDRYEFATASVMPVSKAGITVNQPDMLYGTAIDEIIIEEGKSAENKVKIYPYTKNIVVNINIPEEERPQVNTITAQLKGISSSVLLSARRSVLENIPAETLMNTQVQLDGNLTMTCTTFGPANDKSSSTSEVTSVIEINTTYKNNTRKTITADVTTVLENIREEENLNQAVIGLKDMGIYVAVSGWKPGTASGSINK